MIGRKEIWLEINDGPDGWERRKTPCGALLTSEIGVLNEGVRPHEAVLDPDPGLLVSK